MSKEDETILKKLGFKRNSRVEYYLQIDDIFIIVDLDQGCSYSIFYIRQEEVVPHLFMEVDLVQAIANVIGWHLKDFDEDSFSQLHESLRDSVIGGNG